MSSFVGWNSVGAEVACYRPDWPHFLCSSRLTQAQPSSCTMYHPSQSSAKVQEILEIHFNSPCRPPQPIMEWILPLPVCYYFTYLGLKSMWAISSSKVYFLTQTWLNIMHSHGMMWTVKCILRSQQCEHTMKTEHNTQLQLQNMANTWSTQCSREPRPRCTKQQDLKLQSEVWIYM